MTEHMDGGPVGKTICTKKVGWLVGRKEFGMRGGDPIQEDIWLWIFGCKRRKLTVNSYIRFVVSSPVLPPGHQ